MKRERRHNRYREMLVWAYAGTGTIIDIDDVPWRKQDRPALWCPECDGTLTPVRGEQRAHHFRHPEGTTCVAAAGGEGALHLNTKFHLKAALEHAAATGESLRALVNCAQCAAWRQATAEGRPPMPFDHPPGAGYQVRQLSTPLIQVRPGDVVEMGKRAVGTRVPDLKILRDGIPICIVEVFVQQPCSDETWKARADLGIPVVEVQADDILELREAEGWCAPLPIPVRRSLPSQEVLCPQCTAWRSQPKPTLKPKDPVRNLPTRTQWERTPRPRVQHLGRNSLIPFQPTGVLPDQRTQHPRVEELERVRVDIYSRGGVLTELCIFLEQLEHRGVMSGELRLSRQRGGTSQNDQLLASWGPEVARDPVTLRAEARKVLADWKRNFPAEHTWHIEWWTKSTAHSRKVWAWNGSEWRRVYGMEAYERVNQLVQQLQAVHPRRIEDKARNGSWLDAEDVDALEARAKETLPPS